MNSGVTPIIPLEITRMLATLDGANAGSSIRAVKSVGGPIM